MRIWSWFIDLNKWSVLNKFQKNSVIILKLAKKSFPRQKYSKTYEITWTFSAWIRNRNRWTQRAFLILAINKCKCSQWQMQCIFSLYWDISLVFISTFCQTSLFDTKLQYSSCEASVCLNMQTHNHKLFPASCCCFRARSVSICAGLTTCKVCLSTHLALFLSQHPRIFL